MNACGTDTVFSWRVIRLHRSWSWVKKGFAEEFSRLGATGAFQPDGTSPVIWRTRLQELFPHPELSTVSAAPVAIRRRSAQLPPTVGIGFPPAGTAGGRRTTLLFRVEKLFHALGRMDLFYELDADEEPVPYPSVIVTHTPQFRASWVFKCDRPIE